VNQKVEPLPYSLLTPTSPAISSASFLEIARPRPVPPKRRVVEISACEKLSNRRDICSLSQADAGIADGEMEKQALRIAVANADPEGRPRPAFVNLSALLV
jgi:hypothetical protein